MAHRRPRRRIAQIAKDSGASTEVSWRQGHATVVVSKATWSRNAQPDSTAATARQIRITQSNVGPKQHHLGTRLNHSQVLQPNHQEQEDTIRYSHQQVPTPVHWIPSRITNSKRFSSKLKHPRCSVTDIHDEVGGKQCPVRENRRQKENAR